MINTQSHDLNVGTIDATTGYDTTLLATSGNLVPILDSDAIELRARLATLTALGRIELDTEISQLVAESTGTGDIVVRDDGDLTIHSAVTANGEIDITLPGQLTATALTATGNAIVLSSLDSGITIGPASTGDAGSITLTAAAGTISHDGIQNGSLSTASLSVTAGHNIELTTDVQTAELNTTGAGYITLQEHDGIVITNLVTTNGPISVTSGGQVTAQIVDASQTDLSTNTITLLAADGIDVGEIQTGPTASVTLTSSNGSVVHDDDAAIDVTTGTLTATAASDITLDTETAVLVLSSTGDGAITITESDDVIAEDISTANGAIQVDAIGQIQVRKIDAGDVHDVTLHSQDAGIIDDTDSDVDLFANSPHRTSRRDGCSPYIRGCPVSHQYNRRHLAHRTGRRVSTVDPGFYW